MLQERRNEIPPRKASMLSPRPRFDLIISAKRRDAEHAEESGEFLSQFQKLKCKQSGFDH
jgi:hypothetical protein